MEVVGWRYCHSTANDCLFFLQIRILLPKTQILLEQLLVLCCVYFSPSSKSEKKSLMTPNNFSLAVVVNFVSLLLSGEKKIFPRKKSEGKRKFLETFLNSHMIADWELRELRHGSVLIESQGFSYRKISRKCRKDRIGDISSRI